MPTKNNDDTQNRLWALGLQRLHVVKRTVRPYPTVVTTLPTAKLRFVRAPYPGYDDVTTLWKTAIRWFVQSYSVGQLGLLGAFCVAGW